MNDTIANPDVGGDRCHMWLARDSRSDPVAGGRWRLVASDPDLNGLMTELISVKDTLEGLEYFIGLWDPISGFGVSPDSDFGEIPKDMVEQVASEGPGDGLRAQICEAINHFYTTRLHCWGGAENCLSLIEEMRNDER